MHSSIKLFIEWKCEHFLEIFLNSCEQSLSFVYVEKFYQIF